jgi:hypothetical protein
LHRNRFEDLEGEFAGTSEGALSDVYTAGNIGAGVLRAFRIIFDFANKQVAFMPLKSTKAAKDDTR